MNDYPNKTETLNEIKARLNSNERGAYHIFSDGHKYVLGMGFNGSTLKSLERDGLIAKYNCPRRIFKGYWRLTS